MNKLFFLIELENIENYHPFDSLLWFYTLKALFFFFFFSAAHQEGQKDTISE